MWTNQCLSIGLLLTTLVANANDPCSCEFKKLMGTKKTALNHVSFDAAQNARSESRRPASDTGGFGEPNAGGPQSVSFGNKIQQTTPKAPNLHKERPRFDLKPPETQAPDFVSPTITLH